MAIDGIYLHKLIHEIRDVIIDGRIMKIYQPDKLSITMKVHSSHGNNTLSLSANPNDASIYIISNNKDNPANPPLFCMVLRKHLEGGFIKNIEQIGLDRVVAIDIESRNEIGVLEQKRLILEIMGKHSNIILLDHEKTIIDGIKRYTNRVSRHREVLPNATYIDPPPQNKTSPFGLGEERFTELLLKSELTQRLQKALYITFDGISPIVAKEILHNCNLDQKITLDQLGIYELRSVWQEMIRIINKPIAPSLMRNNDDKLEFSYQPLYHFSEIDKTFDTLNQLTDYYYQHKGVADSLNNRKRELVKVIATERDKLAHKIVKQEEEFAGAANGDIYRTYGELLSAYMYQVEHGSDKVHLYNFSDNNKLITIPLDASISPQANTQRYFKLYTKSKTAKKAIGEQLETNKQELNYLDSILFSAENVTCNEDIESIKLELMETGYLKEKKNTKDKKKAKELANPPLSFNVDGYDVLLGRNNKQNDLVTLKMARGDDIWLHAKDIPGSHGIIRHQGTGEIPPEVIKQVAKVVAYHSKAKDSNQVPVDYTKAKLVKKPNGTKPGMVIYFEQKTIFVKPSNDIIKANDN